MEILQKSKSLLTIAIVAISAVMTIGIGYAISQTMMTPEESINMPQNGNQMMPQDGTIMNQEQIMSQMKPYIAILGGVREVPPKTTSASGRAEISFDTQKGILRYALVVSNISNITQAHIHIGSPSVNGPAVVWLFPTIQQPGSVPGMTEGMILKGTITSEDLIGPMAGMTISNLENEISLGNGYVNVHTTQNPDGEIRGQLIKAMSEDNSAQ